MSSVCPFLSSCHVCPSLSFSLFRRADVHHFTVTSWVLIHFATSRASASRLSRYRVKAMNRLFYRVCLQLRCSAVAGNSKYPNITDVRCRTSIVIPFTVRALFASSVSTEVSISVAPTADADDTSRGGAEESTSSRCLLPAARCLLPAARCPLSVARWLLSAIRYPLSDVRCPVSTTRYTRCCWSRRTAAGAGVTQFGGEF